MNKHLNSKIKGESILACGKLGAAGAQKATIYREQKDKIFTGVHLPKEAETGCRKAVASKSQRELFTAVRGRGGKLSNIKGEGKRRIIWKREVEWGHVQMRKVRCVVSAAFRVPGHRRTNESQYIKAATRSGELKYQLQSITRLGAGASSNGHPQSENDA